MPVGTRSALGVFSTSMPATKDLTVSLSVLVDVPPTNGSSATTTTVFVTVWAPSTTVEHWYFQVSPGSTMSLVFVSPETYATGEHLSSLIDNTCIGVVASPVVTS